MTVPRRPLLLLAITIADYLLWQWSASSGPQLIALVTGLVLLPLAIATIVLAAGALARGATRHRAPVRRRAHRARRGVRGTEQDDVVERHERLVA